MIKRSYIFSSSVRAILIFFFPAIFCGLTTFLVFAATVPNPPDNVAATPLVNGQASLTWAVPSSDGGSPITDYEISYRTGNAGAFATATDGVSTTTSYTLPGLTDNSTYEFHIGAVNAIGTSTVSTSTYATPGNVLFSDPFSTTTINSNIWTEADSAAGGAGGTAGNVQQTGTALTIKGNSNYGTNALYSTSTFDRTLGTTTIDADITISNCAAATTTAIVGYGDINPFATTTDAAYSVTVNSGLVRLNYFTGASLVTNNSSGFTCTSNVPFHAKLQILPSLGVRLYINGTTTANTSIANGTFTNKPVFIQSYASTATTTVDNFALIAPPTVPSAPTGLAGTPGLGQVALTWNAPASDGGSNLTNYEISYRTGSNAFAPATLPVSTSTSATITGLNAGTSYEFRVGAVNAVGTSTVSSSVFATPTGIPSSPTSVLAVPGNGQVSLSWTAPNSGGSAITDYQITERTGGSGSYTTVPDGVSTSTSYTVTGLTNNTTYEFQLAAVNAIGTSTVSTSTYATPGLVSFFDPLASTTIDTTKWTEADSGGIGASVGNVQESTAGLTIKGDDIYGDNVLYSTSTFARALGTTTVDADISSSNCAAATTTAIVGYGDINPFANASSSAYLVAINGGSIRLIYVNNGTTVTVSNTSIACTSNVPFHAKLLIAPAVGAQLFINGTSTVDASVAGTFTNKNVFAESFGSGATSTFSNFSLIGFAAGLPGAPTALMPVAGNTQVALTWTAPASNGGSPITDYLVEYKLTSDSTWTTFADGVSTSTAATVTGLTNNSSYDFRVSTMNIAGTSSPSTSTSSTPVAVSVPGAPVDLEAVPMNGGASLSWSPPLSDGGSPVTSYELSYRTGGTGAYTDAGGGVTGATSTTVINLTNNTTYEFRVAALNSVGTSTQSSSVFFTPGSVVFFDPFSTTTINSSIWTEADSAAGGAGGSAGNVRETGTSTTIVGNNFYAANALSSTSTYDRTLGTTVLDADVSSSNCAVATTTAVLGYGDINPFANASSSAYLVAINGGIVRLILVANGATVTLGNSNFGCTSRVPFHVSLLISSTNGAQLFINGTSTANASVAGTFSNKNVFIQSLSTAATTTFDNVSFIAGSAVPSAPLSVAAASGDGQAVVSWNVPQTNAGNITDYQVAYKSQTDFTDQYTTASFSPSVATSRTITGLTDGVRYSMHVTALNPGGASLPSPDVQVTPLASAPQVPSALSPSIAGFAAVGENLEGTYTFLDPNGDLEATSTYQWYRSSSSNGTYAPISGATGQTYQATSSDLNKYLKFEVTPVSMNAPATGVAATSSSVQVMATGAYLNEIVATGQSLSVGVGGNPALTTTQPYSNEKLDSNNVNFVPLVETSTETMNSAEGNYLTAVSPGQSFQDMVTNGGLSGASYALLKKGTALYNTSITQVTSALADVPALSKTDRVIAITNLHGGADDQVGHTPVYDTYLNQWQSDFNTDIKALTGQSTDIPMFLAENQSFSVYPVVGGGWATSSMPIVQLEIAQYHPTRFVMVAPDYMIARNPTTPLHFTNAGYRLFGEYFGKVIKQVIVDRQPWQPLMPVSVRRKGNIIFAKFHVPVPPLVLDTTLVDLQTNYGFEYSDDASSASISSVSLLNGDTVKITLNTIPTGANQRLRYAYTATPNAIPGPHNPSGSSPGSARGNLRDSDATTSSAPNSSGQPLYNWSEVFDDPVVTAGVSSPPVISGVASTSLSAGSFTAATATISWNTDLGASSQIQYGLTPSSYLASTTVADSATVGTLNHQVVLPNLIACSVYHYNVLSTDVIGQNAASTSDAVLTTSGCPGSTTPATSTTAFIGTGGGSLSLNDATSSASVTAPASFGTAAYFQIKQLKESAAVASTSLPAGLNAVGTNFYDMKALTTATSVESSFGQPLTVTLSYNDSDLSNASVAGTSTLTMKRWDQGAGWQNLSGCNVDAVAKTVTCSTSGFSTFGIFGQTTSAPGTPTSVTAVPGDAAATVSFTAPSNGGSAILYYTVTSSPGNVTATSTGSPITVTGLTNGTPYTFTVTATNAVGTGAASAASNSVTPAASTATSFTFSGPSSGNVNATSSNFTITPNAPYTGTITITPTGAGSTGLSPAVLTFSGASSSQTFAIRPTVSGSITLTPTNSGSLANPSNLTYMANAVVPNAPTALTPTPNDTQVGLSWTGPASNGGSAITDYVIEYKKTSTSTWSTFNDGVSTSLSATVTGLVNATSYDFRVSAVNAVGTSSPSGQVSATPSTTLTVPDPPTSVTATASDAQATISFNPASNGGSIVLYYTVTSSPGNVTATSASGPITLTGLTNGTPYTFTVTATNAVGTSSPSTASNSVTPASVPNNPTSLSGTAGDSQISLSWMAPLSNGGSPLVDYLVEYKLDASSTWNTFIDGVSTSLSATVTGLMNYLWYDFRVSAVNAVGTSSPSGVIGALPTTVLTVQSLSGGGVNPSGGNGSTTNSGASSSTPSSTPATLITRPAVPLAGSFHIPSSLVGYRFPMRAVRNIPPIEVKKLQIFLNNNGFVVASSGVGSPGHETGYFGALTKKALIRFQEHYADKILKPVGLVHGTGYFGLSTRAFINSILGKQ